MRVAVAARARGDVYPLLLSSFGCGPASFAEHLFEALTEGYLRLSITYQSGMADDQGWCEV